MQHSETNLSDTVPKTMCEPHTKRRSSSAAGQKSIHSVHQNSYRSVRPAYTAAYKVTEIANRKAKHVGLQYQNARKANKGVNRSNGKPDLLSKA
jgi:hypothetical protein